VVGRGESATITFVAEQLNHGLPLLTKRSGLQIAPSETISAENICIYEKFYVILQRNSEIA